MNAAREKLLGMTRNANLQLDEAIPLAALGGLGATPDLQALSKNGRSPKVRAAAVDTGQRDAGKAATAAAGCSLH